jgi:hypothetical protein
MFQEEWDNHLQFPVGRDIRLDPPQQADPFDYFIYPYVGNPYLTGLWKGCPSFAREWSNGHTTHDFWLNLHGGDFSLPLAI